MPYLVAAVVLLGVLCLLNLLLTLGVLRRLREQAGSGHASLFALGPGSTIGDFTALTTDDEPVSRDTLMGVVAFFSAACDSCHELLPRFVEHARGQGRENVLAIVGGDDPETVRALTPVARVVQAEFDGGPVARAFQNTLTPALYLVGEGGLVAATGHRVEDMPQPPPRRSSREPVAGKG
ncbi:MULTISPECIES: peroxiredoxin family protein [Thermomonosporaceae]|uniref:peroxiredoxin family protein n=1 Tax=Thermomonosporaceae TaxID=2012 RepID=UPI00255AED0B|nr:MULTISPECIES: hypothetical protein [Thermomonosporaceae]MDL4776145.1 hypothetical protein [Actinomadura xylanilytica]